MRGVHLSIFSDQALSKASGLVSKGVMISTIMASPKPLLMIDIWSKENQVI